MVRLAPDAFAAATYSMCDASGPHRTRIMIKLKLREGLVGLKSTDGHTTLTTSVKGSELKLVEQIATEFVTRCTRNVRPDAIVESSSKKAAKKASGGSPPVAASEAPAGGGSGSAKSKDSNNKTQGAKKAAPSAGGKGSSKKKK